MTTPRIRAIVSLASALTLASSLAACAGGPAPHAWDGGAAAAARPTLRFDNDARQPVHVYLIGEQREWLLGRVAPGAHAMLRLPAASLDESAGLVRLAVLADAPLTMQAAADPRATIAIAQRAATIVTQRWSFSQAQLAAPQLAGVRADLRRP